MTLAVNLAEFAVRESLSAKLTAAGTEMIINGLGAGPRVFPEKLG